MESNFYTIWEGLDNRFRSSGDVVCFVPLVGYYGFRQGEIMKVDTREFDEHGRLQSGRTYQKCTNGDLAELQKAIDMATPQLIMFPYYSANDPVLLMYGTGRTGTSPVYQRGNKARARSAAS